jgi:hypothetical protein
MSNVLVRSEGFRRLMFAELARREALAEMARRRV